MISEVLKEDIIQSINSFSLKSEKFIDFNSTGGGCINRTGKIITDQNSYFVKWNNRHQFPGMFDVEKEGLEALGETDIRVPQPLFSGISAESSFLLMEWIDSGVRSTNYWDTLAIELAGMHKHTHPEFGWRSTNYIGSLLQENNFATDWIEFFIHNRLEKQLKMAFDGGKIATRFHSNFNVLFKDLPQLLPIEPPSLIHGDLWSGNVMVGNTGNPVLIDPAVYFGNREIELAFTHLFGGFNREFYEAYDSCWPLQPGFMDRIKIYNLYPLLVHVNLFGGGYIQQVENIISDYR